MNKRVAASLRLQLFCAVLVSLAIAVATFGASFLLGSTVLNRTVYGAAFSERMADQQFFMLQEYVEEEDITLDNLQQLNAWCSRGDKVYLTIYHQGTLVYESPFSDRLRGELNVPEYDPSEEDPDSKYTLMLPDEVKARAFLYYYAGDAFYFWMTALSGLLAFVAFSLCFVSLISRKVSYISQLKEELDILSGGQLEYPITISGRDELSELAAGIDQMRRSIIRHQEAENQIRSANSQLITAMSHDLRTPLTSLLAYLEIIERKKYTSEEQMHHLVRKSVSQTMRIKRMADQLFSYFLAYATEWDAGEMETLDADSLFHQLLGDYAYALQNAGLQVETDLQPLDATVRVNPELLQRALDNLYSNILKYAAPTLPVQIACRHTGNEISVTLVNSLGESEEKCQSTGLGLITCRRIVEYLGGQLVTEASADLFRVSVSIPTQA